MQAQLLPNNETREIPSGSIILDMGVEPQTIANGLKPYGLVYKLIKSYNVPVIWSINPSKVKDGMDFTVDGRSFKGGPFIIEEGFLSTAVKAEIANWQALGVNTYTTQSSTIVPLHKELTYFANWVLDTKNGDIAAKYLDNAGIPQADFRKALPTDLNDCDDLFVLPHADPEWTSHGAPLLAWNASRTNGGNEGWIWSGCHAVSALENLYNPANPTEQTNFLSVKTQDAANNNNNYFENALILWGNHSHASGNTPYPNAYPENSFMQFIGRTDGAQSGGSEQVYIPVIEGGWRASTKIGVWDPSQSEAGASPREAALIAFGYAFGDDDRGMVMYQGGHKLNESTAQENVAAQRAFLNFSFEAADGKAPKLFDNSPSVPSLIEGGESISFDVTGTTVGGLTPTYEWTSNCNGTFSNTSIANPTFTTSEVTNPQDCVISVTITDSCGRQNFKSWAITVTPPPFPPVAVDDNYTTYNTVPISFNALENDTDINMNIDPASFNPTSPLVVAGGTFVHNGNGEISFTPTPGFVGTAILNYTICDDTPAERGGPLCDSAVITVNISGGSCGPNEVISQETAYGESIHSINKVEDENNALGAPDGNFSKMNDNSSAYIIIDLGANAYIGTDITFRIASDDNNSYTGTIDAAATTTAFPTTSMMSVTTTVKKPAVDTFTITAIQPGTRYVKVTGPKKFLLESVTFQREVCTNIAMSDVCTTGCNDNTFLNSHDPNTIEYDNMVGAYHSTLAKKADGSLWIWGENTKPSGNGHQLVPTEVSLANGYNYTGEVLKYTAAEYGQFAVLTTDGLYIWGKKGVLVSEAIKSTTNFGAVAIGTAGVSGTKADGLPVGVSPEDVKMLFGTMHTLGIVTCNGDAWILFNAGYKNADDKYGDGVERSPSNDMVWHRVEKDNGDYLRNVVAMRGTVGAMMALTVGGEIYTWGTNTYLGNGSEKENRAYATKMTLPEGVTPKMIGMTAFNFPGSGFDPKSIDKNYNTYYLLSTNGQLYSLGNNHHKQLGDFTTIERKTWVKVRRPNMTSPGTSVDSGEYMNDIVWISPNEHDYRYPAINVLDSQGNLFAWGRNSHDMLGPTSSDIHPTYMPGGLEVGDRIMAVETGGHTTMTFKQCTSNFGYVGHRTYGSMGDGNIGGAYENTYNFTDTPEFNICGAPTTPNVTEEFDVCQYSNETVDLTSAHIGDVPNGLSLVWYTTEDQQPGTEVQDPRQVGAGVYYAFYNPSQCDVLIPTKVTVKEIDCFCTEAPNIGVVEGNTKIGISTFNRDVADTSWAEGVQNGFIKLESKNLGFVPTRLSSSQRDSLNAEEGMMIWNIDTQCLEFYNGTIWVCSKNKCNR
ncbi:Ig-like domain-containing protein [Weeksellaceae bacterium KMM 9713]|uniref:Ig-like domain-containing protein n=1 Tax=Profundicola chukchiensis TaxID=2961959 RepID=A0A9X4MXW1_9FLAO|nr:Ig-like domain-containing protein [Profundicola chukchiensis]MDG4946009.1 Ig-like domain-containing protein [Profundicola chukchiensis]